MLNKRIWKTVLSVLLMLCLCTGMLPAELTFARSHAAQAEESALPVPAASDAEVLSDGGWLYRVCADGYAEIVGYADVSVTSLSIPASLGGVWVGSLAQNAFADNAALASITIPSSVAYIPDTAFPNHTALSVRAYNGSAALSFAARRGFECKNTSQYDFFDTILDLSEMRTSQFTVAGSSIVVSAPYARQMREGMKLFFPANGKYTDGLPVKVLSVTQSGTSVRITFTALDFMETLETYKVEDVSATPDYENIVILADGFELVPQEQTYGKGAVSFAPQIAFKVEHELSDSVTVEGEFSFSPSYELSVDYGWFKIKEFSYTNKSTTHIDVGIKGEWKDGEPSFKPIKFARIPLSTPTLISVWLDTSMVISASGEVKFVFEIETIENITWNKDGLISHKDKETKDFSMDVAVEAGIEFKAALAVNIGFAYTPISIDVAELAATLEWKTKLETSTSSLGCADVGREIEFKVSVRIGILNKNESKTKIFIEAEAFNLMWKLDQVHFEIGLDGIHKVPVCSKVKTYRVIFADNYSGKISEKMKEEDTFLVEPEPPERRGYAFTGWYKDGACTSLWDFSNDKVTKDITLYAGWKMDTEGGLPPSNPSVPEEPSASYELIWSIENGEVTITGYTGEPTTLEVPETIEGYPVTGVAAEAFNDCGSLTKVDMPSVKTIGSSAFCHCDALITVNLPSATMVDESAFQDCEALITVDMPSVITVGSSAFQGCESLVRIDFPAAVTISFLAFASCQSLINANLPSVTNLGGDVFYKCPALTNVNLSSVSSFGMRNFRECDAMKTLVLSEKPINFGHYYNGLPLSLGFVVVPNMDCYAASYFQEYFPHTTVIKGSNAATVCYNSHGGEKTNYVSVPLGQRLVQPENPNREDYIFNGWYKDQACTIPWDFDSDVVEEPVINLYAGWKPLSVYIRFASNGMGYTLVNFANQKQILTLPSNYLSRPVTAIAANAISTGVYTLHIPSSITSIDPQAFRWADDLTAITVDESNPVYRAVDGVLYTRDGTLVSYPRGRTDAAFAPAEGTTAIGDRAIYDCTYLETLTLPETVAELGEYAVYGCENLASVDFAADPEIIGTGSLLNCADTLCITGPVEAPTLCEYADTVYLSYNEYDVLYMENGELLGAVSVRAGEVLGQPAQPEEGVMTFKGWSTTEDGESLWDFAAGTMPENDVTLHAVWRYDFTTEAVEGGVKLVSYTGSQTRILVPETVDGQPVVEIAADAFPDKTVTLVGNKGSVTEAYATAQSMTFEALTYTVAFESNGGTYAASLTLNATDKVPQPDVLRTGWTLVGWYVDSTLTTAWDFTTGLMPASDLTLYAGWEKTDENAKEIPFTFDTTEDGLIITGYTGAMGAAEIPETINGATVVGIADHAFHANEKLLAVTIPGTVKTIGASAFNASRIGSVTMETGVASIGAYAFADCPELSSITLPDSVAAMGEGAFHSCTALTAVQLPAGLTALSESLFSGCTFLEEVALPDDLETIGAASFANCAYLNGIRLGAKVSSVARDAFRGCTALAALEVDEGNLYLTDENGVLLSADGTQLMLYPEGKADTAYTLPDGVITLADSAMRNSRLQTLTLNDELMVIGQNALYGSRYLEQLVFAANGQLTSIEQSAFGWCTALKELVLPETVAEIAQEAFAGCDLDSITIPADAVLGEDVFSNHSELTIYGEAGSDAQIYAQNHGVRFIDLSTDIPVTGIALSAETLTLKAGEQHSLQAVLTPVDTTETALVWSSSNTSIASVSADGMVSAWYEGEAVITATAANGSAAQCVVTVEANRVQPTELKLSASELSMLPGVMLPIQAIQSPADCTVLPVTWTSSNSSVAQYLNGCIVTLGSGTAVLTATASNGLTASCTVTVETPAFGPADFFLPNGLKEIGAEAFRSAAMTAVRCPDGLTRIGEYAFADCAKLAQIAIPSTVTEIDSTAFEGCVYVVVYGETGSEAEAFAENHANLGFVPW